MDATVLAVERFGWVTLWAATRRSMTGSVQSLRVPHKSFLCKGTNLTVVVRVGSNAPESEDPMLRLCSYNVEHFNRLFTQTNQLQGGAAEQTRLDALRVVLQTIDADIIGVVEAPNTTANGAQSTVTKLESFAAFAGLRASRAMTGLLSSGTQEIAVMFDPQRVTIQHRPGGRRNSVNNPRFDEPFQIDTDDDRIREIYEHFRPPLEALVQVTGGPQFRLMVVHAKSKGIFNAVDLVHWERENQRNRRKLFAEATSIRRRIDQWLDNGDSVVVMGDINDGPGMDSFEYRFGRSAVEIIMGDIFRPGRILASHIGQPAFRRFGWEPSSARFRDRFTEDLINVLIDHILASQDLPVVANHPHKVWNPFQDDDARPLRDELPEASDHFPVTLDLDI